MAEHVHIRYFQKGDEVLTLEPYSVVVEDGLLSEVCSFCLKSSDPPTLRECHFCGVVVYCDYLCQRNDWDDHFVECEGFRRSVKIPNEEIRMIARVCARFDRDRNDGCEFSEEMFGLKITLHDLKTYEDKLTKEDIDDAMEMTTEVKRFIEAMCDISREDIFKMVLRCQMHFTHINGPLNEGKGQALYLTTSAIGHSCEVHERYVSVFDGRNFIIRALEDIQLRGLDDLKLNYIPVMMSRKQRQTLLRERYFIECDCKRCTEEVQESVKEVGDDLSRQIEEFLEEDELSSHIDYLCCFFFLRRMRNLPDREYLKYVLLCDMQVICNNLELFDQSLNFGVRVLNVHIGRLEREAILVALVHSMVGLGWHLEDHKGHYVYLEFAQLSTTLLEENRGHVSDMKCVVKELLESSGKGEGASF